MELGKYYKQNQRKLALVNEREWKVALNKCKWHIIWKLKQKTLSGAHTASRLGTDPVDYYLEISYEKILSGKWEWKDENSLVEQMIRIVNSHISTEVEKKKTKKEHSFNLSYNDVESEFYNLADPPRSMEEETIFAKRLKIIGDAISGDLQLEIFIGAVREGMKRADIAALLDLQPRQLDKVKERLFRKVRTYQSSSK